MLGSASNPAQQCWSAGRVEDRSFVQTSFEGQSLFRQSTASKFNRASIGNQRHKAKPSFVNAPVEVHPALEVLQTELDSRDQDEQPWADRVEADFEV